MATRKYSRKLEELKYVSKNFKVKEFRCLCGCDVILIDDALLNKLQQLREQLNLPIFINSAYRCDKHNTLEGGSPKSQHLVGKAVDIDLTRYTPEDKQRCIDICYDLFNSGGIGLANSFIHVDVRGYKARWTY